MSLATDMDRVYEKHTGAKPKSGFSVDMALAFTEWIKRQKFRINDFTAFVEIDKIKTTGDIQADVKETTILGQYAPIIDVLETLGKGLKSMEALVAPAGPLGDAVLKPIKQMKQVAKVISKDGATLPALDMKKEGGQGGTLIATGHAYIGEPAEGKPDATTTDIENDYATIALLDGEEVD